ncbi:hypothetical protein HOY82DRAFT_628696 [Tuber indicum]|nr:hypothetical protein HOY82DRAFT_628696 [Tuber indicum]
MQPVSSSPTPPQIKKSTPPRASLGPALTLKRGLSVLLHHRFISSSGKLGAEAVSANLENQGIVARNFMNKTRPNPMGVRVRNGQAAYKMMSTSTVVLKNRVFAHTDGVQGSGWSAMDWIGLGSMVKIRSSPMKDFRLTGQSTFRTGLLWDRSDQGDRVIKCARPLHKTSTVIIADLGASYRLSESRCLF